MAWNGENTPPQDFLVELYGEEDDDVELDEVALDDDDDDEVHRSTSPSPAPTPSPVPSPSPAHSPSPTPPPFSPLTSPVRRDRSPLWANRRSDPLPSTSGCVVRLYGEDGTPLGEDFGARVDGDNDGVFMTADAHALFECTERMEFLIGESVVDEPNENSLVEDMNANERVMVDVRGVEDDRGAVDRSIRGRVRAGRRGRGSRRGHRGLGVASRRRGAPRTWVIGHPLEEIWMTDDDVPLELREMARDIVRRRQTRTQANVNANRSTRERRNRSVEGDDSVSEDEDVFEDASDGRGNSLLEEVPTHFEWSPMETFRSEEETFRPEHTGSVTSYSSPYDAFRSYWDENILEMIVEETNRYAPKIPSPSFQAEWYATNSHEILCLFAFWMMLGIIRMPTIRSCFSLNPLLKTEIFRRILTYRRYCNLVRALHFVDSDPSYNAAFPSNSDPTASSDRLYRLRPILDHLNAKFQANYILSKDICIDESLTLWKGRLNIKQYIQSKAAKFGIKTFELCESATGYLWSFLVYTGRYNASEFEQDPTVLKSTAVVKKLIAPLLNKGYRLFMDNWYNCPLLARFLKRNGTDCVGTLRPSRQDVPPIVSKAPLKQGQLIARHAGDVCVLSWQDKKRVTMISTCHSSAIGLATIPSRPPTRALPFKPQVVLDYNKSMGGVDLKDQMLEPYLLERKRCAKWYMKLFKRLLNCSILNARTLLQSSRQRPVDHLQFRLQLVDSILVNHLSHCPESRSAVLSCARSSHPLRVVNHTHWPVHVQRNPSAAPSNRVSRARCVVCASNRIETRSPFKCETCNVALCMVNCFRIYHS